MNQFQYKEPFVLETGGILDGLQIAYHTYGTLNESKSNVVWICHALTANAQVTEWWPGVVGKGRVIDPEKYFIVCANIIGSCYGSTGPASINPETGVPYFIDFPFITIRDMVKAHQLLRQHLGIEKIQLMVGGSMGGYQALEWCVMEPELIDRLFLLATSAKETPWGIAIHTTQRLAIEADATWGHRSVNAGEKGLKAARAIAMLTYRNYDTYKQTQTDPDENKSTPSRVGPARLWQDADSTVPCHPILWLLRRRHHQSRQLYSPALQYWHLQWLCFHYLYLYIQQWQRQSIQALQL